jgi:serine/threonine protein kinase
MDFISHNESTSAEDAKLALVLEDYLSQVEQGHSPNVREIIEANPEIADRLQGCLDSLRLVHATTSLFDFGTGDQADKTDRSLGDYRIIREIARGGMGVVYEAEQISLNRRVALKVLPFASMLDERQLQRFKNEAMAAAQLDHPNIVHVHGTGCERGVHYYAMQLIEGDTLAGIIERTKKLNQPARSDSLNLALDSGHSAPDSSDPQPSLDTGPLAALSTERSPNSPEYYRTIAQLGIQIAEALEYAHSLGDRAPGY